LQQVWDEKPQLFWPRCWPSSSLPFYHIWAASRPRRLNKQGMRLKIPTATLIQVRYDSTAPSKEGSSVTELSMQTSLAVIVLAASLTSQAGVRLVP
jgi:hypothetical protein